MKVARRSCRRTIIGWYVPDWGTTPSCSRRPILPRSGSRPSARWEARRPPQRASPHDDLLATESDDVGQQETIEQVLTPDLSAAASTKPRSMACPFQHRAVHTSLLVWVITCLSREVSRRAAHPSTVEVASLEVGSTPTSCPMAPSLVRPMSATRGRPAWLCHRRSGQPKRFLKRAVIRSMLFMARSRTRAGRVRPRRRPTTRSRCAGRWPGSADPQRYGGTYGQKPDETCAGPPIIWSRWREARKPSQPQARRRRPHDLPIESSPAGKNGATIGRHSHAPLPHPT